MWVSHIFRYLTLGLFIGLNQLPILYIAELQYDSRTGKKRKKAIVALFEALSPYFPEGTNKSTGKFRKLTSGPGLENLDDHNI